MRTPPTLDTPIQRFLRQTLIDNPYLYVDYWLFVHFFSGLILGILFAVYFRHKSAWLVVVGLLIVYEIFEVLLDGRLFVSETLLDKFWDVIIGLFGFLITYLIISTRNKIPPKR